MSELHRKSFVIKKSQTRARIIIMKFKLFLLASLLIFSCNSSDNESISLYNFLPNESSVIININDLNNTKEILNKNKILPIVLSSTKEISTQLNLLSNKNSEKRNSFLI